MASVEGDLHAALMAQVETITGYPVIYPQAGGDKPAGEHLTAYHLPNDNTAAGLAGSVYYRQGFLVLTLVSPTGVSEAVTKGKAGDIVETYFKRGLCLDRGAVSVKITGHSVKQGRQVEARWETPIWISYWSRS